MTTTNAQVIRSARIGTPMSSRGALLTAMWAKMTRKAIAVFRATGDYVASGLRHMLALVPRHIVLGAAAATLATRAGYEATIDVAARGIRFSGRLVSWTLSWGHYGLNWVGYRAAELIGRISEPAGASVGRWVSDFSAKRASLARTVTRYARMGLDMVQSGMKAQPTVSAVTAVSTLVLAGAVMHVLPIPFLGTALAALAKIPVIGWYISAGAAGTMSALASIAKVGAVAGLFSTLVGFLPRRPETVVGTVVPRTVPGTIVDAADDLDAAVAAVQRAAEAEMPGKHSK